MSSKTREWRTEIEGLISDKPVLFKGFISEWMTNDGKCSYLVTANQWCLNNNYYDENKSVLPFTLGTSYECYSLDHAKRDFKKAITRHAKLTSRISWREVFDFKKRIMK